MKHCTKYTYLIFKNSPLIYLLIFMNTVTCLRKGKRRYRVIKRPEIAQEPTQLWGKDSTHFSSRNSTPIPASVLYFAPPAMALPFRPGALLLVSISHI